MHTWPEANCAFQIGLLRPKVERKSIWIPCKAQRSFRKTLAVTVSNPSRSASHGVACSFQSAACFLVVRRMVESAKCH
jgi:hypothetical protein